MKQTNQMEYRHGVYALEDEALETITGGGAVDWIVDGFSKAFNLCLEIFSDELRWVWRKLLPFGQDTPNVEDMNPLHIK